MRILLTACVLLASVTATAADVYVDGHMTKDGVFVPGHYRSAPDHKIENNYSTQGNVNPYTGQSGTVNPYNQQRQYQPPPPVYYPPPPQYKAPAYNPLNGCNPNYPASCIR